MLNQLPRTRVLNTYFETISVKTRRCLQFIDLTESIQNIVDESGIREGICNIQTQHTTTAIVVNENEPLLISDMQRTLERLAPRRRAYRHDDFSVRTVNLTTDEKPNGHAHCKALFLPTTQALNLVDTRLQLGRWQRIFLLELDCARQRQVSVMIVGV